MLTSEQAAAIEYIKNKENIFITSNGAGCGKTYLLNYIIDKFGSFWGYNKKVAATATTGVASLLLDKGRTLHSWAGIGKGENNVPSLLNDCNKHRSIKRWEDVDILIIDEISLMSPILFDKLEELARIIRKNDKPFGGIQLIISGDWLQLPTVSGDGYAFEANSWNKCIKRIICLKKIIRQKDILFQNILNCIRIGDINDEVKKFLLSRVNVSLNNNLGIKPTKLYCVNEDIDRINNNELNKLIKLGNINKNYDMDYNLNMPYNKNNIHKKCNLASRLNLSIDCQVMLLTNLSVEDELVNGSRGIVVSFSNKGYPEVKFLNNMTIEIIPKKIDIIDNDVKIGYVSQIPLKLAYASTIHKMQGSTLDYVIINLERVFENSQAYVGLSRVKCVDGLSIEKICFDKLTVNKKALNFYLNLE